MSIKKDTIKVLKQTMKENGWSVYAMSEHTGICYETIKNILYRSKVPSTETVENILKVCGYKLTLERKDA